MISSPRSHPIRDAGALRPAPRGRAALVLLLWAAFFPGRGHARPARPALRPYVVQPGDSCWRIAEKVFGDGRKYDLIHRYNRLGPLPHLLKPGQRIWLPGRAGGPLGRLTWLLRDVKERAPRAVDWKPAQRNQGLWKLHRVATGPASSARIEFLDASRLRMRPEALLVIYGGAASRTATRRRPTTVVLERGTLRGGLARLDREAGLQVRTPSSQVTLRSTLSQVEVDRLKTSIVSVYQGIASVFARGRRVQVPKDHGTWTRMGRRPARPVPLPRPPAWRGPTGSPQIVLVPQGLPGGFEAAWRPAPRAHRYRVEVAEDPRFNRILVDAQVGAGVTRFAARDLRPGTYYARIATRDRHGLESRPGPVRAVRLVPVRTSRRLTRGPDGHLEVVGGVLLRPPVPRAHGALFVSVDGGPARPWRGAMALVRPGLHRLRYGPAAQGPFQTLTLRVLRVRATIATPAGVVDAGTPAVRVTVQLRDERGRDAALPGLRLAAPWTAVPLAAAGPGRYRADLTVPATWPSPEARLQVAWPGGVLGTTRLGIRPRPRPARRAAPRPVPRPARRLFFWPHRAAGPGWAQTAPGQLGEPARAVTAVGLSAYLADGPRSQTGRDAYLVSALRASLALVQGRLGIAARLPWFDGPVTTDQTGARDIGDLSLHVLGVAWQGHGVTLSPSFGTVIPTAGYRRPRDDTRYEPGLRLDWTYLDGLTVGTNQVFSVGVEPESSATGTYAADLHLVWQPLRWLSLGAELDWWIGVFGPAPAGTLRAAALTGSVWFNLGRGRIGLIGGGGLNRDAWDHIGRYRVGLTADLGFWGL